MESLHDKARTLFESRRYEEAIAVLLELAAVEPGEAAHPNNLCFLYSLTGRHRQAIPYGQLAVSLNPRFFEACNNLGNALSGAGRHDEAITILERGLEVSPQAAGLWTSLGLACFRQGQIARAQRCHEQAIKCDPRLVEAYCNLGITLQAAMEAHLAQRYFVRALVINPAYQPALANYMMGMQYLPALSAAQQRQANSRVAVAFPPDGTALRPRLAGPVRVGFMSADFCQHPVGYFLLPLFRVSRAADYRFVCFDNHSSDDALHRELRQLADDWVAIGTLGDTQAAQHIRDARIDVLIDLSGYTVGTRLGVFTQRPAPCQVSWLGYFASTGLADMDFVLLSEDQVQAGVADYYSERIRTLACCQFNYLPPFDVSARTSLPSDETGVVTLGCFNNPAKISQEVLALWAGIMLALPESRLVLKWKSFADPEIVRRIHARFNALGVPSERLSLSGASPHQQMLAEYNHIDIALDPFPFSGALTTCEALWMGVPVVTFKQLRPVSCQSASILKSLGLSELIAETPRTYKARVLELAADRQIRLELRRELRSRQVDAAAVNTAVMAAEIEQFARERVAAREDASAGSEC